jgi:DNA-binding MarR family transcriptional regulator
MKNMATNVVKLPINREQRCLLRLENQLCFQIYRASRVMTQAYRPLLDAVGLTYPQYLVMLLLWEKQADLEQTQAQQNSKKVDQKLASSNVSELGKRLGLDSGTLSPLLKRLQQQGLLTRQRSTQDERQLDVVLTTKGIKLSEKAAKVPAQLMCDMDIPTQKIQALKKQLESLLNAMSL